MTNIMLDLETFGIDPNAAIIAIGAVQFFPEKNELGEEFYRNINLQSAVDAGGLIDPNVVVWWMKQEKETRGSLFVKEIDITVHVLAMLPISKHKCST